MTMTEQVTLAAPAPSSVRVTMDATDPRRGRLVGLGWRQVTVAAPEEWACGARYPMEFQTVTGWRALTCDLRRGHQGAHSDTKDKAHGHIFEWHGEV